MPNITELDGLGGFVSTTRAAQLLKVKQPAIDRRIQRGKLRAVRCGSMLFVRLSDVLPAPTTTSNATTAEQQRQKGEA